MRETRAADFEVTNNIKSIILYSLLASFAVGCSSDDDLGDSAVTLVDPIEQVVVDTSIGGNFEGAEYIPNPENIEPEPDIEIGHNDSITNTITDADIQRAPELTYEAFGAAYHSVTFESPDINTAGNEFANEIIDQLILSSANEDARSARSIFDQFGMLTEAEKAWYCETLLKEFAQSLSRMMRERLPFCYFLVSIFDPRRRLQACLLEQVDE